MRQEFEASVPGTWANDGPQEMSTIQVRTALVAVALLSLAGLWVLGPFLPAIGWGIVFAVALWPWYSLICDRWPRHKNVLLPAGATLLIVLAFVLPVFLVFAALAQDRAVLTHWLTEAAAHGITPPLFVRNLPFGDQIVSWWQSEFARPDAFRRLSGGGSALPISERFFGAILHRLFLLGFMLLILFFLLRSGERIALGVRIGSRRAFGPAGEHVGNQIVQAIRGTVNGLVVVGFGEGLVLGVVYAIAGVPHPTLFALVTALFSAIPFGAVFAFVAAAGLLAVKGQVGAAIAIILVGSLVVFVADHFIRPVLIGGATRLPFLWVLLGILGGIEAWGLIGVVLGPALMAALMLLWREWIGAQKGPLNPRSDSP